MSTARGDTQTGAACGEATDNGDYQADEQRLLDDLFDEHEGWFPSVDVCARCGDCYCDGIGCIAAIDPDNTDHHERLEDVQDLIRQGNAWRLMQRLIAARPELDALALANYALANTQGFHPLPELPDLDPVGVSCYSCPNGTTQAAEQRPEGGWTYEEYHGWRCPTCAEQIIAALRIDAREAEREARSALRRCEIYAAALREIVEPSGYRPSVEAAQRVARQALKRSGEAGSGNAPTPAPASEAGSVLPPPPSDAGAPPPPTVPDLMEALEQSVNAAKAARQAARNVSSPSPAARSED